MNILKTLSLRTMSLIALPTLIGATAMVLAPTTAQACGGFFCQITPVEQNAERILFEIEPDGVITTTVEISYAGEPEGFSWVVPILETPDLLVVPPSALRLLDGSTVPSIIAPPTKCSDPAQNMRFASPTAALSDSESGGGNGGVDVEDLPQVGPFDPEVVSSDDADALIVWLNANGYLITPEMEPFIAGYVTSGMKFLAMKLAPGAGTADITPISMQYTGQPMVPISLTSVSAEPEMGVMVFVAGAGRYESANFGNLEIDVEDVQASPLDGSNNYYPLLSWMIDEQGGRAFVTEFADTVTTVSQGADSFFLNAADDTEARAWLAGVLSDSDYVTRMYTRISGWEMEFDPTFSPAPANTTVSRVFDLSGRPAVEVCGPNNGANVERRQACGQTYCGQDAMCASTDAGIDGCLCPEGTTARVISEPAGPGGFLRETVTCQRNDLEFLANVLGTADGPADPCDTATCGQFGQCVAVNGFATCDCDDDFAAVPDGAGGAVCSAVKKSFGPDQLLWDSAGCAGGCSTDPDRGDAGAALLLLGLLAPIALRRRR
jgi:MYXO-CTERM domain-containing protein